MKKFQKHWASAFQNYWTSNMTQLAKKFVFVKKDIPSKNISVRKNEIGIVKEEKQDSCLVFFLVSGEHIQLPRKEFEYIDVKKTGDDFSKKVCNVCHRLLDIEDFAKNQNAKNNRTVRRPSCRECRKKIDGIPIPSKEKRKWTKNKPAYEPFQCPICQKTTIPSLTSRVVLDHNHDTGKVRGWICDSCNTGIGRFKDDISLLESAIAYLETEQD